MIRRRVGAAALLALALGAACTRERTAGPEGGAVAVATGSAAAPPAPSGVAAPAGSSGGPGAADRAARLAALGAAEHRRDAAAVTDEDLVHPAVEVRRAAARALARIADPATVPRLTRALADGDGEVLRWLAFGLGWACAGSESATVRALVTRAASLVAAAEGEAGAVPTLEAMADALGRCGNADAERTLRAWLDAPAPRAEAAAAALGRLAGRKRRLDDASLVALLDAGSRPEAPLGNALLAFGRLPPQGQAVQARLLEVARAALGGSGVRRALAVRALGRAGDGAAPALGGVLTDPSAAPGERADAARELARLGAAGQPVLADALAGLVPATLDEAGLVTPAFGVLITALESLERGDGSARPVLERLAAAPAPEGASVALARRLTALRCRAAALLAGADARHAALLGCDPDPAGRTGALGRLAVLGRGRLTGARARAFAELARSQDRVVRQAALEVIGTHPELKDAPRLLAEALGAPEAGTVATAATVIATWPDRVAADTTDDAQALVAPAPSGAPASSAGSLLPPAPRAIKPDARVARALGTALDRPWPEDAVETRAALLDAAAALQLLSARPLLLTACASPWPVLRQRAEKALRALGDKGRSCPAPGAGAAPAAPAGASTGGAPAAPDGTAAAPGPAGSPAATPPGGQPRLVLETDVGELRLTLDGDAAPAMVARLVALVRAGFLDGTSVHRVVPGFVAQLGDPGGDGYGGSGRGPVRCETSPLHFGPLTVGVALAGRDTGSSQFFVTLGDFPHLDGDYAWIGRAEPGWERLAVGDVVRKARVE